jgi:hypothetical protein
MIVFILVAVIGLVLLVISAVFGIFGDDIEVAPEVEGGGPHFLSLRSIAVFLTAFGTVGAIARYYNLSAMLSSLWGVLAGVAMSGIYLVGHASCALPGGELAHRRSGSDRADRAGDCGYSP